VIVLVGDCVSNSPCLTLLDIYYRFCVYCIRIQCVFCLVSGSVTPINIVTKEALQKARIMTTERPMKL